MNDETQPDLPPTPPPADTPPPAYTAPPAYAAAPPRLRDRVLGFRAVAAVAVASLLLGGVGGAALGAVSDGRGSDESRFGPGRGHVPGNQAPGLGTNRGGAGQFPPQGDGGATG